MKKMKKIAATLLCLGVAISTLCACSSTGNSGEQPVEEPTTKQTEAVTEVPETTTEAPTTTTEETTEAAAEGKIIPLWNSMTVDDSGLTINQLLSDTPPADWFQMDFVGGIGRYWFWAQTDHKVNGSNLYHLELPMCPKGVVVSDPMGDGAEYNVEIYFVAISDEAVSTHFEVEGSSVSLQFLPLYYDTGKKCVVGYWMNAGATTLVECYWSQEIGDYVMQSVEDPSVYGF